jgi:hypothetical protein
MVSALNFDQFSYLYQTDYPSISLIIIFSSRYLFVQLLSHRLCC